jgi:hypothetical protein
VGSFARLRWEVDLGVARRLGAAMIVLGVLLPRLPHDPGLPCPLRTITGVPCPLCGMTTSVKAACAGRVHDAVGTNPFGLVAVTVAMLLLVRPRWRHASLPVLPLALLAAASWGWELHRFHIV